VVAVGVQTSFLPFAKRVTEKTTAGWIVRKPTKRPCKPRDTRGGDFWRLGISLRSWIWLTIWLCQTAFIPDFWE